MDNLRRGMTAKLGEEDVSAGALGENKARGLGRLCFFSFLF
jgi:hypothetical protein